MIYIWAVAFGTIFLLGVIWYLISPPVLHAIEMLSERFPWAYDPTVTGLAVNIMVYFSIFVVFAVLLWVFVNSQKVHPPYYGE